MEASGFIISDSGIQINQSLWI